MSKPGPRRTPIAPLLVGVAVVIVGVTGLPLPATAPTAPPGLTRVVPLERSEPGVKLAMLYLPSGAPGMGFDEG